MSHTEITEEGYFSRLTGSILGLPFGLLLLVVSSLLIF